MIVERTEILSPVAQELIRQLNEELSATYPEEGATHFRLDPDEVAPGRGGFFVAREEAPLGCGALRRIGEACELKRMFVRPEARGRGVGRAILDALIDEARALGASSVVLETGTRQLHALALYRRAGFVEIAPFGEYVGSPLSICMRKTL
jgi:GNAT superfamily N-acetyltransferase